MRSRPPTFDRHTLTLVAALTWLIPCGLAAVQAPDSAGLHREARDAQAAFERARLRNAPEAGPGWGGSCDEMLGRLCLRLVDTGDWWPEPPDAATVRARSELLRQLTRVGGLLPGDSWVLGQRAVYLAEAGAPEGILPDLDPCPTVPEWWCDALAGFALHRAHRFEEAGRAFDRALAAMPPEEGARWMDPRPVLDREGRESLDATPDRPGLAARFWALSDPLFLVPGNDRRTEHLARQVEATVREDGRNGYGLRWGRDLAEALIRYGPEVGWEARRPGAGEVASARDGVGHHHPESRSHVAPGRALTDLASTEAGEWNPGERYLPRSGYAPSYAPVLLPAAGLLRTVPRGDQLVVIALLALPGDTSFHSAHGHPRLPPAPGPAGAGTRFGLFAADSLGHVVAGEEADDGRPVLRLAPGRYLLSAEVWAPDSLRAGRIRRGLAWGGLPPDVPVVSDLLLADPVDPSPDSLEALLPHLRTGEAASRLVPGETVLVAWEIHGLGWSGPEEVRYELVFEQARGGFLTRIGRTLGVIGDPARQELAWGEQGPASPGPFFRTARLTLPPEMEPGDYLLRLRVGVAGRETMLTEQPVRVRPTPMPKAAAR